MSSQALKLIVGLGNPGEKYAKTRHNAGFLFLDTLCQQVGTTLKADKNTFGLSGKAVIAGHEVRLVKPETFMNESGRAVRAAISYYKIDVSQMLIVHDELDLDPGVARLKVGGGHGGNNGLRDIIKHCGTKEFARLRLGIGHPGVGRDVSSYVLKQANKSDQAKIDRGIDESLRLLDTIVEGRFSEAMNDLHSQLK